MSDKQANTLLRAHRVRVVSAYGFAAMTVTVAGVAVLRDTGVTPPSVWGIILMLWVLTGVAAIDARRAAHQAEWQARQAKRAKQLQQQVDLLSEAARVAGWVAAMEEDNVRRINRR